jgi:DNA-binding response OmpR family regulator
MISGHKTSPEHLAKGLKAAADGYLIKPVEPKVLLVHIHVLLRIKKAKQVIVRPWVIVAFGFSRITATITKLYFHLQKIQFKLLSQGKAEQMAILI